MKEYEAKQIEIKAVDKKKCSEFRNIREKQNKLPSIKQLKVKKKVPSEQ